PYQRNSHTLEIQISRLCKIVSLQERGINTGILLMDLEKLRRIGWHQLWFETIKGMLRRTSRIRTADQQYHFSHLFFNQDIYNAIFGMQPQMVYQLSCLWNVQVLRQARSDYCPVTWPVRAVNEADCEPLRIRQPTDLIRLDMPKLLHFCGVDKPESETNVPPESFRFASDLRVLGSKLMNNSHSLYPYSYNCL
ncbi:Glycosyltransferase protein LARGE, partial [Paragonimus heterotremus]